MAERGDASAALRAFVSEAPLERVAILDFLRGAAAQVRPGARVLDAGAGDAPYRELFAHAEYVTCDWAESPHAGGRTADVIAPLDHLPIDDESFDAVVTTQVLEHVAQPAAVVRELFRVLVPGGRLWITVPFVGELHEEPYDFYRYTRYGIESLLRDTEFTDIVVEPLGGYFTTLAQLSRNCGLAIGAAGDSGPAVRVVAAAGRVVSRLLPPLDRLDRRRALPLGWLGTARRPASR